jgi:ABC-type uncharacterized transport system permease subunit
MNKMVASTEIDTVKIIDDDLQMESTFEKTLERVAIPIISFISAIIVGSTVLALMGYDPVRTFSLVFFGIPTKAINAFNGFTNDPIGFIFGLPIFFIDYILLFISDPVNFVLTLGWLIDDPSNLPNAIYQATPLILTGLSVAVAFRAGLFNIGTEGQLLFGGFVGTFVGFALVDLGFNFLPFFISIPLVLIGGMVGGAAWAFIPAYLKAKRGVHEVISTIMMNYIAYTLMVFFAGSVDSPFIDKNFTIGGNPQPETPPIISSAWLPRIFDASFSQVHYGIFFALAASIVIYILLYQTKFGYDIRAVGHNPSASKYGGINVTRNLIFVMLVSGALAGLAGTIFVMGSSSHDFNWTTTHPNFGFDGIAVALLGGNHPIGVLFGAFLFGWLKVGGQVIQGANIPQEIASTTQAMIVFFVAIPLLSSNIIDYFRNLKQRIMDAIDFKQVISTNKNILVKSFIGLVGIITIIIFESFLATSTNIDIYTLAITALLIIGTSSYFVLLSSQFKENFLEKNKDLLLVFTGMFFLYDIVALNKVFNTDVVVFSFIVLVIIFILLQEIIAFLKRKSLSPDSVILVDETHSTNNAIARKNYLFLIAISLVSLVLTSLLVEIRISASDLKVLGLVAFNNLGIFAGLGSAILILVVFLWMVRKDKLKFKSANEIKYMNLLFYISVALFMFIMFVVVFDINQKTLFRQIFTIGVPIGYCALAGLYSEKSGVVNIGLEGMMLAGAFVAVAVTYFTNDPWAGVVGSIVAGILMGLLHAVASIKYRADQVVVGVAINLLAAASTALGLIFIWDSRGNSDRVIEIQELTIPFIGEIPFIGDFFNDYFNGYSALIYIFIILVVLTAWIIGRTSFGIRVRAVGEYPKAADTLGINVYKIRYICVTLSGVLASVGGAQLTLGTVPLFREGMTTGRGYIGLASLIFGGYSGIGAALASFIFAFANAFKNQLDVENFQLLGLPLFKLAPALPYIFTLFAVAIITKGTRAPAADGIPYVKEGLKQSS